MQFAGGLLTVDDQVSSIIYQMSEAGVISRSTPMADSGRLPAALHSPEVGRLAPNASGLDYLVYAYPAGGTPRKTITGSFSSAVRIGDQPVTCTSGLPCESAKTYAALSTQ